MVVCEFKECMHVLRHLRQGFYMIPYSGKFLHGANFRSFREKIGRRDNKNHEIFDLYLVLIMDYRWVWSCQSASVKLRTTKFSSEGWRGNSAKFCTSENFPLYGISSFSLVTLMTLYSCMLLSYCVSCQDFILEFFLADRKRQRNAHESEPQSKLSHIEDGKDIRICVFN